MCRLRQAAKKVPPLVVLPLLLVGPPVKHFFAASLMIKRKPLIIQKLLEALSQCFHYISVLVQQLKTSVQTKASRKKSSSPSCLPPVSGRTTGEGTFFAASLINKRKPLLMHPF